MEKINKQLNKFLEITADVVLSAAGKEKASIQTLWPIPTPQGLLYWGNEWAKKLNYVFHLMDKQEKTNKEKIKALMFSSRPAQFLWRIEAIKNSNLNKKEKLYTTSKLFDCLELFRKKDLFCKNGKNLILNKREIGKHKQGLKFFSSKEEQLKELIFNFEAALWLYTELLYWTNHPLGHNFHGPYSDKEGVLLIKEYFDLKPEIWSFSQNLNFSKVQIFEIYKKGTSSRIKLDFFERGIRTTQSFKQNLEKVALRVDEKTIKQPKQVSRFFGNLMETSKKGVKANQSLNEQQMFEKHAEIWFYAIKPLCDLVKEDWHPPKQVQDNIYKKYKEIDTVWQTIKRRLIENASLPYRQQLKIMKESFDPRL